MLLSDSPNGLSCGQPIGLQPPQLLDHLRGIGWRLLLHSVRTAYQQSELSLRFGKVGRRLPHHATVYLLIHLGQLSADHNLPLLSESCGQITKPESTDAERPWG